LPTRNSEVFVRLGKAGYKEFRVAAIIEKQLQMPGIEPELTEGAAELAGKSVISGRASPTLVSGFVDELEEAAVPEEEAAFSELCVCDVIRHATAGKIGECQARYPSSSARIDLQWFLDY
jgi:hypothetical protein